MSDIIPASLDEALATARDTVLRVQEQPQIPARHRVMPGTLNVAAMTAICAKCGEVKVQRKGVYRTADGTPHANYRCENYIREHRERSKHNALVAETGEGDPIPTPRRGRPPLHIPDVVPSKGMTYKQHVELSQQLAAQQHNKCGLCDRTFAGYLELMPPSTPAGQRLKKAVCQNCRKFFELSYGSISILERAIAMIADPDLNEYELKPELATT